MIEMSSALTGAGVATFDPRAFVADGAGGFWIAGDDQVHAALANVGADGVERSFRRITGGDARMFGAAVRPDGSAAFALEDRVAVTSAAGVDQAVMMAQRGQGAAVAFADGGEVAIAQLIPGSAGVDVRVQRLSGGTLGPPLDIAFGTVFSSAYRHLFVAAVGNTTWVAFAIQHPATPRAWFPDGPAGQDLALARIVDGALDAGFGSAGIAHASGTLAWQPMTTETLADVPVGLSFDADGVPWLVGSSRGGSADKDFYTRRGPGAHVVRFLK